MGRVWPRHGHCGPPLNSVVRQPLAEAAKQLGTLKPRLWTFVLVAIAAEFVYLAGRTFIRSAFGDAIPAEFAVTAWRLVFVFLYFWFFLRLTRDAREPRGVPWHPLLLGVVLLDLAVGPFSWRGSDLDWATSIVFMLTTPVVALREELFYRGILQGALERALHPMMAIMITAAAFVLSHLGAQPMDAYTISAMAAAGVLLGVIYQRTKNLWFVVTLHTLYDWVVLVPHSMEIAPFAILAGNVVVMFGAMIWWTLDKARERTG